MRISDWSSDVCSSDLPLRAPLAPIIGGAMTREVANIVQRRAQGDDRRAPRPAGTFGPPLAPFEHHRDARTGAHIGSLRQTAQRRLPRTLPLAPRTIDRKSVGEGKGGSVRGYLVGVRILKK